MNGCGKTTLLRAIGERKIAIPEKILIQQLNKEVDAGETSALDVVLKADDLKARLVQEADELGELMASEDLDGEIDLDSVNTRLSDIYEQIEELEQEDPTVRACAILSGLGFS